jgi:NAD(P)-dependent dehydrogenase (short-subunit alcohol dehydrogenase family)
MTRTALITGATSGLGRALADALADEGWRVLAHGRNQQRCEEVATQIRSRGGDCRPYLADLASLREVTQLGNQVAADVAGLNLLVNNAGVGAGRPGAGRELSADGVELRLAVNYLAPVRLTELLAGTLRAAGPQAQVLNIGSVGQSPVDRSDPQLERGYDGMTAYVRSKFALAAFTFDLAERWRGSVNVNCVHPATYMDTAMVRESGVSPWASVATGCAAVLQVIQAGQHQTGGFYDGAHKGRSHPQTYDPGVQKWLAELAAELIAAAS